MKTLIKHSQYFLGTFKKGLENLGPASFNSRNALWLHSQWDLQNIFEVLD